MPRNQTDIPPAGGESMPPSVMTKAVVTLAVILLLGASGTAAYFYKQLSDIKKDPNKLSSDELKSTITAVGRLIVLPTGEEPTLATVADLSKLKDQPFFANAKVGDKVLIYTNAKKAVLYDPQANKIVDVAPVNIGNDTGASAVSGASTTSTKKK